MTAVVVDPFDSRLALAAPEALRPFNVAGVLTSADVHVAVRLGRICGESSGAVLLAAALAVRAPRLGHVCTDLATVHATADVDPESGIDPSSLPWPSPDGWVAAVAGSPLCAHGALRVHGSRLYLARYFEEERAVAEDLAARASADPPAVDVDVLRAGLARLFAGAGSEGQRLAAAVSVLRRFAVVGGGPGTGKTTTVARILALLHEQPGAAPRVALAAPTGKAAARLAEAVHEEASRLDVPAQVRDPLLRAQAFTLHRLLGARPRGEQRFRHHRGNRLPHDVVIVDETSMVSLSMTARLLDAVRPDARLILVGDPQQLASVEAGAVLGDIVGPVTQGLRMRAPARELAASVTGTPVAASDPPGGVASGDGIVLLRHVHRFSGGIGELASAIQRGDADAAVEVLGSELPDVVWLQVDAASLDAVARLAPLRDEVVSAGRRLVGSARAGDATGALLALGALRVLCAHRSGPYGAARWAWQVERWLAGAIDEFAAEGPWYAGRPLMVTHNDYALQLFNGDTGVVVSRDAGRVSAVFERRGGLVELSPTRLSDVETVHATTIHKSQGSQFDAVAVVLPDVSSPILTRELLYTAVTRARRRVTLVAPQDALRAAVSRPVARASGLGELLWARSEDHATDS